MNVCKVPDMCKDMEYKYITEDSKTRVYLSVVREFNEAEYEKYYIHIYLNYYFQFSTIVAASGE